MDKLEPEFADAFDTWKKQQTPESNAAFLRTIEPVIGKAVRTHVGQSNPLVQSRARRMALDAMRSYDPARSRLQTHLFNQLQGLKRYAGQQGQILSVPERVLLDRRAVELTQRELEDELGREPTDEELSGRTGFSLKRLQRVRAANAPMSEGFFSGLGDGGFSPAVNPMREAANAWLDFVYDDLSPIDKKIMEWSLGLNGQPVLSNQQIAVRLKRSPGAVSQRKLAIQKLLDQEPELSPFAGG